MFRKDAKLAPSLGTLLAWADWWPLFAGTLAAFLLAAPASATVLLSAHGQAGGRRIPFAPFMVAGTFLPISIPRLAGVGS